MQTLSEWARENPGLKKWLQSRLDRLAEDKRKSVAGRAKKLKKLLSTY